jgi:ketosteroid isomerase-like protein
MRTTADTVKSFYDAYNRRDWVALAALMAPGIEWWSAARGELVRGTDAVIALFQSAAEGFPHAKIEVRKLHEAGEFVIAECCFVPRSPLRAGAGPAPERAVFCEVVQFVDGKCVRGSTYADTFRMLEAGLARSAA